MPIPDWNKQLYLDPCFLPSEADKKTHSYQREIQAEGRKIYACLKPASTLLNCLALGRNVRFNQAGFAFPGGCRSQHQCCSRHPPDSQHTAPICFYMEMTTCFPSTIYTATLLFCASTAPFLPWALGNLNILSTKTTRHCRGENNLHSDGPTKHITVLTAFWDISSPICYHLFIISPHPVVWIQLDLNICCKIHAPSLRLALLLLDHFSALFWAA